MSIHPSTHLPPLPPRFLAQTPTWMKISTMALKIECMLIVSSKTLPRNSTETIMDLVGWQGSPRQAWDFGAVSCMERQLLYIAVAVACPIMLCLLCVCMYVTVCLYVRLPCFQSQDSVHVHVCMPGELVGTCMKPVIKVAM